MARPVRPTLGLLLLLAALVAAWRSPDVKVGRLPRPPRRPLAAEVGRALCLRRSRPLVWPVAEG